MRQNIVVFTGAGISKESGLSTFRDSDGIWTKYNPDIVATPQGFEADPETALMFYNEMRTAVAQAHPNHAHIALAKLERAHNVTVITQNIDDLHERAGSSNVLHLHGELNKVTSSRNRLDPRCIKELSLESPIRLGDLAVDGSQLRPFVVMFGEYLSDMSKAVRIVKDADIFVVIGTSLNVFPANQLLNYAHSETLRYIIDPNDIKVPNGYRHIKNTATKGVDIFINELTTLINNIYTNDGFD
ncbi:MAG: NAD-dependent protein deacylase [Muribaculaceae bacterium]|nr:NAD-dependent protein deacylase [Muribaculaceae bacterium]